MPVPGPRRLGPHSLQLVDGYPGAVPLVSIRIVATHPSERANELLAAAARRLTREAIAPDDDGVAHILFDDAPSSGAAWDDVHNALEAAGEDWGDYLYLGPRPTA